MSGTADQNAQQQQSTETQNQGNENTDALKDQGITYDEGEEELAPEAQQQQQQTQTQTQTPKAEGETGTEEGKIAQETFEKKINKLTFKRHEEREKREEAERKLAEANETIRKLKGESEEITIPPMPDPYDEMFKEKMAARDEAIQKKADLEARKSIETQRRNDAFVQQQQENARVIKANIDKMYDAAEKSGFTKENFKQAENKIVPFIRGKQGTANFILENEDSHLIVQYLAEDAQSLDAISKMSDVSAAVFIATQIVPKAQALKASGPKPPAPLEVIDGKAGGGKNDSPYLEGVTLE